MMQTRLRPPVHFDWRKPHHWLAFGFGAGLMSRAPGTWGTLAAVPLYLLVAELSPAGYLGLTLALLLLGIVVCEKVGRELGVHDHPAIVWDEVVGYLITMFAAPAGWLWVFVGFVAFRLFDILKPWPIGWLDRRVTGGLGVMLDDVAAGVMAWVTVQIFVMASAAL